MSAIILDGKKTAEKIKGELKKELADLEKVEIKPSLAVIVVGNNPASRIYVSHKQRACEELGIISRIIELPESSQQEELIKTIKILNEDTAIHGVLVQLPLPRHFNQKEIIDCIDPKKDVDCFHPVNIGNLFLGQASMEPCTPAGILTILEQYNISLEGKHCVIIGKSNIVGKPLCLMLLARGATVTICHSKTKNIEEECLRADILISAAGHAGLIRKDMVKKGAVVIDVGINRLSNGQLAGDVHFSEVSKLASAITPVPGGVGPMTIAMLLKNTVTAAKNICSIVNF